MQEALAIFAKSPTAGFVKTRLAPYLLTEECAELYRCMLLDTLDRLRQLSIPAYVFFDGDERFFDEALPDVPRFRQHPGGLGERLEQAFVQLIERGFALRAAIGTDAPDLPLQYIIDAFATLRAGADVVFGPADDGGYYLVGCRGTDYRIFRDIPWSTDCVLSTSVARAREAGLAMALLQPWYDVDSYDDLWRPGLSDPANGAPLTRAFIGKLAASHVPPPSRGRSGGGWGPCLQPTNPIPTPTLPLKGRV